MWVKKVPWIHLILATIISLSLSNCGFKPIGDKTIEVQQFLTLVKINEPKSKNDFIITEHLNRLLGNPQGDKYLLNFSTNILTTTAVITKENQTTRYILNSTTNYSIKNLHNEKIIHNGVIFGTSSYSSNINTTSYSSKVSRENSIARLSKFTAEKILVEIEINSAEWLDKDEIKTVSN